MKSFPYIIAMSMLSVSTPALSNEPVKLLSLDWSSQQVLTKVLGTLLSEKKVPIKYEYTDARAQWYKLAHNEGDVQVEVWEGSMASKFQQMVDSGHIQAGTTHQATTREDWWYPAYAEQQCAGLPDWTALKDCAAVFSEGKDLGIYYTGPWEKPDRARIRALGLKFDVVQLKDGNAINEKIKQYMAEKKPFLIFNWSPNWVEAKYEGKFVEFPAYDEQCEKKASWGVNPNYKWDCGNPVGGWLKIAVSQTLAAKSQCAADIISAFSLDNQQIALAAMLVDDEKLSVEDAAKQWLKQNNGHVEKWLTHQSCG
ncbi:ABC transporter substrate-binding protein [Vibrio ostreicida]|uniref:ABC transporter substrate-binding protein n=1 Tax=Vibrio ostreicida TaxID=526588 RepID=A0ABT8C097_9VIBR|nr:ABC transporter substrate-binding protein [Vibrio ostreicida]MDN3612384.1 ABC transporter substrate-binding protein [Vibrio ostreicida]NPD09845.1 ABC transporter substrate-binding protein [Vibrio ostreicida]